MLVPSDTVCKHPEGDPVLWRYLTFTKFVQLLETGQFAFTRADLFDDPYEGYWSRAGIRKMREAAAGLRDESVDPTIQRMLAEPERTRRKMYVSCWCASEHESAALWKLYLQNGEGVAIRTRWSRLASLFSETPMRVRAGMVHYVDYESFPVPLNNVFGPFMYKRLSFAHESEFRALAWAGDISNRRLFKRPGAVIGFGARVDSVIEGVHVAPTAPEWFGSLVSRLLDRYKTRVPIVRSNLYERPAE